MQSGNSIQPTNSFLIRADASAQIGAGHVMRCLALAQALQDDGGSATFVMASGSPGLEARVKLEKIEVQQIAAKPGSTDDAVKTAELAKQIGAAWVVVDGYQFGALYQKTIKASGLRLLFIDDNGHADHYYADLILNQNIHAHEDMYASKERHSKLLLGTRSALLRRPLAVRQLRLAVGRVGASLLLQGPAG